jgi:hypothetical protein
METRTIYRIKRRPTGIRVVVQVDGATGDGKPLFEEHLLSASLTTEPEILEAVSAASDSVSGLIGAVVPPPGKPRNTFRHWQMLKLTREEAEHRHTRGESIAASLIARLKQREEAAWAEHVEGGL